MQLSNIAVLVPPKSTTTGTDIVARFDCHTGPFLVRDLALVRTPSGRYRVWSRRDGPTGHPLVAFTQAAAEEIIGNLLDAVPSLQVAA